MKHVERSALLPYSPQQMFDIVNDVGSYPAFLPWCDSSRVLEQSDHEMVAEISVAKAGIQQSFVTRNQLSAPDSIRMALEDGPFSSLEGSWTFEAMGDAGCKVQMSLTFDFNSKLMHKALGAVFESAVETMVDAFCSRADELYK